MKTTPLPTVLGGITRDAVLTSARPTPASPIREERFTRDEVYLADEAFFTGTAAEVTPIRELDDRRIGTGRPGPVTTRVAGALLLDRPRRASRATRRGSPPI